MLIFGEDLGNFGKMVMNFTTYLRKNFNAIASAKPIPLTSVTYLAIEQAQYEDGLFVYYDTPLTLQTIVENAIKHGRAPYADPFRISIRTRKTDSDSEIVVK